MSSHQLKSVLRLPIDLETAWEFFSSPKNLQHITPPDMRFEILTDSDTSTMYAGQIITYRVRPLLGIPLFWMTEITHVVPNQYFIDEQRFGPYALWHHLHRFQEIPGGVEMTDLVHYKMPMGFLGELVHPWLVKQKLDSIFSYRTQVLEKRFGKFK